MSNEVFCIGSGVSCSDGPCGRLRRLVVDPNARTVTHLVVDVTHHGGNARLVPLGLAYAVAGQIQIRCTRAEFDLLDDAEETHLVYGTGGQHDSDHDDIPSAQAYSLEISGVNGISALGDLGGGPSSITFDRDPVGEIAIHRGDRVLTSDGAIGRARGIVIDPRDHRVTYVLLDEGHLWGEKEVAIPIASVDDLHDGFHLKITKGDVRDLPPVDFDHLD
jgi:hypothetical protein